MLKSPGRRPRTVRSTVLSAPPEVQTRPSSPPSMEMICGVVLVRRNSSRSSVPTILIRIGVDWPLWSSSRSILPSSANTAIFGPFPVAKPAAGDPVIACGPGGTPSGTSNSTIEGEAVDGSPIGTPPSNNPPRESSSGKLTARACRLIDEDVALGAFDHWRSVGRGWGGEKCGHHK